MKSYLPYLNKLGDQYNSTYHSIGKKPINANYSALTEKIETNPKAPKFKLMIESELLSKGYIENLSIEIFTINSLLKTNPWTYKIKYLNREKIIGSFHEKELLLSKF